MQPFNLAIINRIESLDWLRGFMAIAIMFYHLTYWHIFPLDSSQFLGRLGIYGVSVFFILSGLSMAVVYSKFIVDKRTIFVFYIRRIFRIWPLLWLAVALVTIPSLLILGQEISLTKVLLNLTTLFGFFSPSSYINTGAWSIGNEMFYYALTPIFLISYENSKTKGNVLLTLSFITAVVFAFFLLDSTKPLSDQWQTYINPLNNIFLYVAGIAIYYKFKDFEIKTTLVAALFGLSIAIFLFYPVTGDAIAIVTGVNRVVFLLTSVILVITFYKFSHSYLIPKSIRHSLEQLGLATYGIYLLHPIVNQYAVYIFDKTRLSPPPEILFAVVVIFTIFLAIVSFHIFEKRIMKYGKNYLK